MNAQVGVVAAALFGGAMAGEYAIAEFGDSGSGLMGYIKVANGHVMVDLNFSMVDYDDLGLIENCETEGLSWHLHQTWENAMPDGYGADCGAGLTDWHFDPWLACGGANGNRDCAERWEGCVETTYDCSTSSYLENPLNCEVGDWSGQFGKIPYTNDSFMASYFSYWSPLQSDIISDGNYSTSVVIHCQGGSRAFCAGFRSGMDDMDYSQPMATTTNVFDFKAIAEGLMVQTDDAGYTFMAPESVYGAAEGCDMWELTFHTEWNSDAHALDDECSAAAGMIADPTNQCVQDGSSMYCMYDSNTTEWSRCNDTGISFSYSCNGGFECAVGDAVGRIGNIDLAMCTGDNLHTDMDNNIFCMIRIPDDVAVPQAIIGTTVNSAWLTCASDTSINYCAKLGADTNDYDDDGDDDDDADDDDAASGVVTIFATVFAALVASMQ